MGLFLHIIVEIIAAYARWQTKSDAHGCANSLMHIQASFFTDFDCLVTPYELLRYVDIKIWWFL